MSYSQYEFGFAGGIDFADHGTQVRNLRASISKNINKSKISLGLRVIQNSRIYAGGYFNSFGPDNDFDSFKEDGRINSFEIFSSYSHEIIKNIYLSCSLGLVYVNIETEGRYAHSRNYITEEFDFKKTYDSVSFGRIGFGLNYEIILNDLISISPEINFVYDLKYQLTDYELSSTLKNPSIYVTNEMFKFDNPDQRGLFHESKYLFANLKINYKIN